MGRQREIAQGIVERGADYVLAVKENQERLYEDLPDLIERAEEFSFEGVPCDYAAILGKDPGRIERRECWAINDPWSVDYLNA